MSIPTLYDPSFPLFETHTEKMQEGRIKGKKERQVMYTITWQYQGKEKVERGWKGGKENETQTHTHEHTTRRRRKEGEG